MHNNHYGIWVTIAWYEIPLYGFYLTVIGTYVEMLVKRYAK